jgi:hypothetical protein
MSSGPFTEDPFTPDFNEVLSDHPTLRMPGPDASFKWKELGGKPSPLKMPKQRKIR